MPLLVCRVRKGPDGVYVAHCEDLPSWKGYGGSERAAKDDLKRALLRALR